MERRRTRYPGIYEYTARGGRRRFQVVYRVGRGAHAPQWAASFDTLKEARDHQISQGHRVREGTYFDPKKGEITLAEFFREFMRLAGPEEPKTRSNYEANFRTTSSRCWVRGRFEMPTRRRWPSCWLPFG